MENAEYYQDMKDRALKKLDEGEKENLGQRGNVMKASIAEALREFCRQDGEFAQAVAQGGKFSEAVKAAEGKIHGGAISDLEAWGAAVHFFFPGKKIECSIRILDEADQETGKETGKEKEKQTAEQSGGGIMLDLSDFLL